MYYFPGWLHSDWAPAGVWNPIKPYTDRKPLLGWYDQASPTVLAQQLGWMADNGISFVVMDWYYSQGSVRLDEGLRAYLAVPQDRVKLSLLWANHDEATTPAIWRTVVSTWISRYLKDPRFLTVDGRPVVFIFASAKLSMDAKASNSTVRAYFAAAQAMARAAGLPGIYFVGCTDDLSPSLVEGAARADGYDAVSAYQLHRPPYGDAVRNPAWARPSHGWEGLDASYRAQWAQGSKLPMPLVVPMIAGLDRRPWGGFSADPLHDRSIATPAQFTAHLRAARDLMIKTGPAHSGMGVICCWNEYGEGAFVEPTTKDRLTKLQAVRSVFGVTRR